MSDHSANAPAPIATPKHAATIILIRQDGPAPRVLMGQRGKAASFMPSKFVFPGGGLDASDVALEGEFSSDPANIDALTAHTDGSISPASLALAAVRELWEETGLAFGRPDPRVANLTSDDESWVTFFAEGLAPATDVLQFVFRAITPPTRSKRFDARFFLADASDLAGDIEDLSRASGELSHLSWLTLPDARALDLPFITEVVLAEVEARLRAPDAPRPTPFFHHDDGRSYMDHL